MRHLLIVGLMMSATAASATSPQDRLGDLQVPAAVNRAKLAAALVVGRNCVLLQRATGHVTAYVTLPRVFVASLVADLAGWIEKRAETLRRIALFVASAMNRSERILRVLRMLRG